MLKSYEAIYENGQIKWISDQPQVNTARVIVTFIEEIPSKKRRTAPASIAGKGKTLCDIVSPMINE